MDGFLSPISFQHCYAEFYIRKIRRIPVRRPIGPLQRGVLLFTEPVSRRNTYLRRNYILDIWPNQVSFFSPWFYLVWLHSGLARRISLHFWFCLFLLPYSPFWTNSFLLCTTPVGLPSGNSIRQHIHLTNQPTNDISYIVRRNFSDCAETCSSVAAAVSVLWWPCFNWWQKEQRSVKKSRPV